MLIDISTAVPPYIVEQSVAAEELKKRMGKDSRAVQRIIDMAASQSGISRRHIVIPDADVNFRGTNFISNGSDLMLLLIHAYKDG
jgi:predicted naringenin-chalcone synthase